jgi:hypothetical protein
MTKLPKSMLLALLVFSLAGEMASAAEPELTPDALPPLKPALGDTSVPASQAQNPIATPITTPAPAPSAPSRATPQPLAKRLSAVPANAAGFLFGTVVGTSVCMVRKFPQELREQAHTIAGSFSDKESKLLLVPATIVGIIPAGFLSFLEAPVYSFRDAWMAEKPFSKEQFSLTALDPPERVPHDYVEPPPVVTPSAPLSALPSAGASTSSAPTSNAPTSNAPTSSASTSSAPTSSAPTNNAPTNSTSLPARMFGAAAGLIVGIPVCAVRRPIAGENYGIDSTAGRHSEPRKKIPAAFLYAPCAIVTGLIESPFYALNNSLVNFNKPFSKEQFSLVDEKH